MCRKHRLGFLPWFVLFASLIVLPVRAGDPVPGESWSSERGFIENRGQVETTARYYASGARTAVFFTQEGPVLEIRADRAIQDADENAEDARLSRAREERPWRGVRHYAVRIRLVGASPELRVEGRQTLSARYHYLQGNDPQGWRSAVPAYAEVVYRQAWPGIDLVYRNVDGVLEYEVVALPGADRSVVRFGYEGATSVRVVEHEHQLETPLGTIRDTRPAGLLGQGSIAFAEPSQRGVDPLGLGGAVWGMRYGTFLGGAQDDTVFAVDVDSQGRPVVVGTTFSFNFPTTVGALEEIYQGLGDAFVSKLDSDGETLLWSTYLGTDSEDRGWALRLDAADRPVVAGVTSSALFPVTSGAFDTTYNGGYDAFVAKLEADGSALVWSTLFGGNDREWDVSGLTLDVLERPVICGSTQSTDLPTTTGAWAAGPAGGSDAFVAKLSADGTSQVYGTYLGGTGSEAAEGVALDSTGLPVLTGWTDSTDFPVTPGVFQSSLGGVGPPKRDVFVTKLDSIVGALVFSTYIGGSSVDEGFGIALDGSDRALVTGATASTNYPTTSGSYAPAPPGPDDGFVTKLAADGTALAWSTYLGGVLSDKGLAIALDGYEHVYVAGWTCSQNFPMAGASYDNSFNGTCDPFVTRIREDGTELLSSTHLGGWRDDIAYGLVLDSNDCPVVVGETFSSNHPTSSTAYDTTHNSPDSQYDGFLLTLRRPAYCTDTSGTDLTLAKAFQSYCTAVTPNGTFVDLIEGPLSALGAADIGTVTQLACGVNAVTFGSDATPLPGEGFFQLARDAVSGSYTDGGGAVLVGSRLPLGGDCLP